MPVSVYPGSWRKANAFVYVVNSWKTVHNVFVWAGSWRKIWTYAWEIGAWGNCSKTCGGGTQTRTVRCKRSDGVYVADVHCTMSAP